MVHHGRASSDRRALCSFHTLFDKCKRDIRHFGKIEIQDFQEDKGVQTHHLDECNGIQLLFLCIEVEFL